jgi:hypothetical protein
VADRKALQNLDSVALSAILPGATQTFASFIVPPDELWGIVGNELPVDVTVVIS